MIFTICKTELYISPVLFTLISLLLYANTGKVTAALILAVTVHEAAHLFVMKLQKEKIRAIMINPWGFSIQCIGASNEREKLLCAAAGPTAGIILCMICDLYDREPFALLVKSFSFRLSILNLIPSLPLDGGSILLSSAKLVSHEKNITSFFVSFSRMTASAVMTAGLIFACINKGTYLFIIGIYLIYFNMSEESL